MSFLSWLTLFNFILHLNYIRYVYKYENSSSTHNTLPACLKIKLYNDGNNFIHKRNFLLTNNSLSLSYIFFSFHHFYKHFAAVVIVALGHFIYSFIYINIIFMTFVFNWKEKKRSEKKNCNNVIGNEKFHCCYLLLKEEEEKNKIKLNK